MSKDPPNRHFERAYEIPRFGPFDFLFELRGLLSKEEFLEKAKKINSYTRHMKYTLFNHDDKLKQIRKKEFPIVFFVYDEVKTKGSRLYKKKKYRESIDYFVYSYSMLKWIEFKDPKKNDEFLKVPSLDPILDEELKECKAYLDDVAVEEDSYNASIVYLLMCLSYSYMELRHYRHAIECLDECLEIAGDKVPDLYFRRSQARTYNKFSRDWELKKAKDDIEKAISLKKMPIYTEHNEILDKIIDDNKKVKIERVSSMFIFTQS